MSRMILISKIEKVSRAMVFDADFVALEDETGITIVKNRWGTTKSLKLQGDVREFLNYVSPDAPQKGKA